MYPKNCFKCPGCGNKDCCCEHPEHLFMHAACHHHPYTSETFDVTVASRDGSLRLRCCFCSFRSTQHRQCARFRTTFKFEHEYLWNELRYQQAVIGVFNHYLFHVKCKKNGGLGFTNHKVVLAHSDLPIIDSSRFRRILD